MYNIFQVEDTNALHNLIWNELKRHGIKETGRSRKPTRNNDTGKKTLFSQPLELLETESACIVVETETANSRDLSVPLYTKTDVLVQVPVFIAQSCQAILRSVETEGLFRKAGSSCRQREIKKQLEKGEGVKPSFDVVDLANILKQFLRELPEPLIPYQLHDIFLKCVLMENSDKASQTLHLACLLIPSSTLATLCYLLQFFDAVASNSSRNLMDAHNLSIVMAPTLMPIHLSISSRNDRQNCVKLQNYAKIIQMLIQNNTRLCGVPYFLACKFVSMSTTSLADNDRGRRLSRDKRRHRRSSSFNRVFEGLKKIVGAKSELSVAPSVEHLDFQSESASDLTTSPVIRTLKRKGESDANIGYSTKKKKTITEVTLPGKVHCTTPLTPQGLHFMQSGDNHHLYHFASPRIDLNPSPSTHMPNTENKASVGVLRFFHKKKTVKEELNAVNPTAKTPKTTRRRLSLGRKSGKKVVVHQKCDPDAISSKSYSEDGVEDGPASSEVEMDLTVATVAPKNLEVINPPKNHTQIPPENPATPMETTPPTVDAVNTESPCSVPSSVQGAYVKALGESEKFLLERSNCEQLARQLSRGLRIRRSADQRVIRSPSARKIGAIRRRSRESPRLSLISNTQNAPAPTRRLTRSQSMLAICRNPSLTLSQPMCSLLQTPKKQAESIIPNMIQDGKISLRRGKPNTIRTGLRDPTPMRGHTLTRSQHRNSLPLRDDTPCGTKNSRLVEYQLSPECHQQLSVGARGINRNGSVMKLAQNFASISKSVISSETVAEEPAPAATTSGGGGPFTTPEGSQWTSGEILNRHLDHIRIPLTGRPSVQKIRSENLGKVSAHVRKFDRLASPDLRLSSAAAAAAASNVQDHQVTTTPQRLRSPRQSVAVSRRLSSDHQFAAKEKRTSPKVSPLRESQRANALMLSVKATERGDVKIKAPLLTPNHGCATPHSLRPRPHEVRLHKKASPLKATAPLRRSPRIAYTPI